jgi:hypothetical protein
LKKACHIIFFENISLKMRVQKLCFGFLVGLGSLCFAAADCCSDYIASVDLKYNGSHKKRVSVKGRRILQGNVVLENGDVLRVENEEAEDELFVYVHGDRETFGLDLSCSKNMGTGTEFYGNAFKVVGGQGSDGTVLNDKESWCTSDKSRGLFRSRSLGSRRNKKKKVVISPRICRSCRARYPGISSQNLCITPGNVSNLTPAPSFTPTATPVTLTTFRPTHSPSVSPTEAPSVSPTEAPSVSPTAAPTHCDEKVDIAIVLDRSGSVGFVEFNSLVKPFIKNLTSAFNLGETESRVALTTFASHVEHQIQFGDSASIDQDSFNSFIDDLEFTGGFTCTQGGLLHTVTHMLPYRQAAPVHTAVLLVTDGVPNRITLDPVCNTGFGCSCQYAGDPFNDAANLASSIRALPNVSLIGLGISNVHSAFMETVSDKHVIVEDINDLSTVVGEIESLLRCS